MRRRIRIELPSATANDSKVFYIQDDGSEVDISNCIQGFDLYAQVGESTTATLRIIGVEASMIAEVEETTALGDAIRKYVRA